MNAKTNSLDPHAAAGMAARVLVGDQHADDHDQTQDEVCVLGPPPDHVRARFMREFLTSVLPDRGVFFIAAPYVVSGASMEPTFDNWDYLITDRLSYDISNPNRGDVIVFCLPNTGECSFVKRLAAGEWRRAPLSD